MILPVTLTMAAAAALLNIWLMTRIGRVRGQTKVSVGDGGNEILIRRMRAQANFIENTPLVLILLVLIELATGPSLALWLVGIVYVLARIAHAFGMDGKFVAGRMTGAIVTLLTLLGLAGYGLWIVYQTPGVLR